MNRQAICSNRSLYRDYRKRERFPSQALLPCWIHPGLSGNHSGWSWARRLKQINIVRYVSNAMNRKKYRKRNAINLLEHWVSKPLWALATRIILTLLMNNNPAPFVVVMTGLRWGAKRHPENNPISFSSPPFSRLPFFLNSGIRCISEQYRKPRPVRSMLT